jgi:YfiH family protein
MFYKDEQNIYRAGPLNAFDWLIHGFGTRWSDTFGKCRNLATLHQIHSSIVVDVEGRSGCLGEGDALVSNTPGVLVAVKTADCIPILIVDARARAVAAVHAGWRGTAKNIMAQTIAEMEKKFYSRAEDVHVAIGPGIGPCCYEVGPEVAAQFRQYDSSLLTVAPATHLDLAESNRRQIEACGVALDRIYVAGICTMCNAEFHSYRRDKEQAGRMFSVVGIR